VGQRPSPLPDPNFRQLSARVATPPPVAIRPTSRSEEQSYPPYPRFGEGPLPGASPTLSQGAGSFETGGAPSAPIRIAGASMNMTPFGWRRGMPLPGRPNELGDVPQIPMPHIPDWLSTAWRLGALIPTLAFERVTEGVGDNEAGCDEEWRDAREICTAAARNGWKSNQGGLGPYKKPTGGLWDVDDCARGRVSERCGGNEVDWGDDKRGKTRKRR
jgi:hypothetical protein